MESKIVIAFENSALKALKFGLDRIFIRIAEDGQIRGCRFEEATHSSNVQEAAEKLEVGLKKKPLEGVLSRDDFRIGLIKHDREIDWLTRESHPIPFIFMEYTSSLRWTFESDDGEFKKEHSARLAYFDRIPEIASASTLKGSLECRASIKVTKFEVSYDFTKPEVIVNLKWTENN